MPKASPPLATPVAACALIRRSDGRYLLIRRADRLPGGGHWCPITGRPQTGEELPQTVAREVFEEVGLRVRVGGEIFQCPTSDGHFMLRWFDCEPMSHAEGYEPLTLAPEEVAEARWQTASEASRLEPTFEATAAFFRQRAKDE